MSQFLRLSALVIFLAIVAVVSAIVDIGNNLRSIHVSLAWIFYAAMATGIFWYGVRPLMAILSNQTRDWSPLLDGEAEIDPDWAHQQATLLLKRGQLSSDEVRRLEYHITFRKDLPNCLRELLQARSTSMDEVIFNQSRMAFLAVAVSQNGPLDALLILSINIAMVKKVIDELGIRPSMTDLFRIYAWVAIGAVVMDQFEDLEFGEAIPAVGSVVGKSVVQGMGAALLTLRAGYLTKAYLMRGNDDSHRKEARKWARIKLSGVVVSGMGELPKGIARKFESLIPNIDLGKMMRSSLPSVKQ